MRSGSELFQSDAPILKYDSESFNKMIFRPIQTLIWHNAESFWYMIQSHFKMLWFRVISIRYDSEMYQHIIQNYINITQFRVISKWYDSKSFENVMIQSHFNMIWFRDISMWHNSETFWYDVIRFRVVSIWSDAELFQLIQNRFKGNQFWSILIRYEWEPFQSYTIQSRFHMIRFTTVSKQYSSKTESFRYDLAV